MNLQKSIKSFLVITTLSAAVLPNLASARPEVVSSNGNFSISPAVQNPDDIFNGLFEFTNDADLSDLTERQPIHFTKGEPVALKELNDGTVALSALISDEEKDSVPNHIVVSREDLKRTKPKYLSVGNAEDLERQFTAYPPVEVASRGRYHVRGRQHFGGYAGCVAYVCQHVGCNGPVGNGVGMTRYLSRRGWARVSCASAPAGSVASWSGGHGGRGHTAILTGSGWCYDLGCEMPGHGYGGMNCVAPTGNVAGGFNGWGS